VVIIKVSVMYANTPGARFDHTYLIKARLGNACKHYSVDKERRIQMRDTYKAVEVSERVRFGFG
jgi:hypothetical protein